MAAAVPTSVSEASQGRPPESPWLRQQRHAMINTLLMMVLVVAAPAIVYSAVVTLRRGSLSFNGAYYFAAYLLFAVLLLARRIPAQSAWSSSWGRCTVSHCSPSTVAGWGAAAEGFCWA